MQLPLKGESSQTAAISRPTRLSPRGAARTMVSSVKRRRVRRPSSPASSPAPGRSARLGGGSSIRRVLICLDGRSRCCSRSRLASPLAGGLVFACGAVRPAARLGGVAPAAGAAAAVGAAHPDALGAVSRALVRVGACAGGAAGGAAPRGGVASSGAGRGGVLACRACAARQCRRPSALRRGQLRLVKGGLLDGLPPAMCRLLHRAVDQQPHPRHAAGQACGRALRAARRGAAMPAVRSAGATRRVHLAAPSRGHVRRQPRTGHVMAGAARAGDDARGAATAVTGRALGPCPHEWRVPRQARTSGARCPVGPSSGGPSR